MSDKPPIDPTVSTVSNDNANALVNADIPCLTCEYNLRSLSTQGRCPECGQPVSDTLDHRQLLGQAATLNELVGFATSMTTSLIVVSLALVGKLVLSQIPFGPFWSLIMLIFVPFYYLTAMGGGVDLFRITKRSAFRNGGVVVFMCIIAAGLAFIASNPSPIYLIVSFFFIVTIVLLIGTPAWFAQHTKHLADLVGNAKLKTHANVTVKICFALPISILIFLGWSVIGGASRPLIPIQRTSALIKFVALTILLATSISSALLGLRLVTVAKKLRRTAEAMQSQSSIDKTDSA